jgi:hypothetical protein
VRSLRIDLQDFAEASRSTIPFEGEAGDDAALGVPRGYADVHPPEFRDGIVPPNVFVEPNRVSMVVALVVER